MKKIFITDHAKQRFAERTTIDKNEYQSMTTKAYKQGLDESYFVEPAKSYIKSLCHDQGRYIAKVYDGYVFIFNNDHGSRLLTVYKLDEQYSNIDEYKIKAEDYMEYCAIKLTEKKTGKSYYWSIYNNLTLDEEEAEVFRNQVSANRFIYNNSRFDYYIDDYTIEVA